MKKLVIKTVCITLASVIGAMAVAFGSLALFAPGVVGGLFDGVGNYSASVFFYEKQYKKTGDIKDLNTLVSKIDIKGDSDRAEDYYAKLLLHKDFAALCQRIDANGGQVSSEEYYCSCYALSLAENGKLDAAITFSKAFVDQKGYTENNPFRTLIYDYASKASQSEFNKIAEALNTLDQSGEFYTQDVNYLNSDFN